MYLDDQHPIDVRDRFADITANAMFSGPTAVDFSMLPGQALVPTAEAKMLAAWKAQDLASHYREIRRRDFR